MIELLLENMNWCDIIFNGVVYEIKRGNKYKS